MSNQNKRPLNKVAKPTVQGAPDFFMNPLDLPQDVRKEILEQGQEFRWIDYKKYEEMGGAHERGWSVYKRKASPGASEQIHFGAGADKSLVRRGSNVLAVRPKEWGDQHRAYIESQTKLMCKKKRDKLDAVSDMAKESGGTVTVFDHDEHD